MDKIKFSKNIPDIIWGNIPITDLEWKIIHSADFSRLKGIQQMGLMSVVFPSATHTRYDHSIGVMYVADRMLENIKVVRREGGRYIERGFLIDEVEQCLNLRQCFRLAALFHDLGHPPFSHVIEELFRKHFTLKDCGVVSACNKEFLECIFTTEKLYSHEPATVYLLKKNEIFNEAKQLIRQELGAEALDRIVRILEGNGESIYKKLHLIIDGDLDADKIDYICRDYHYCVKRHGICVEELFENILVQEDGSRFFIKKEGITAINSFLHARYRLIRDIQNYRERRIAIQMFIDLINRWLEHKEGDYRATEIIDMHVKLDYTDSALLTKVRQFEPQTVEALETGNLVYREMKNFSYWNFDPVTRVLTYSILAYPPAIAKLQQKIRQHIGCDKLLLDIRVSKPPELNITLLDEETSYAPVHSSSEVAHGILCDSIRDLNLYIYAPSEIKDEELSINTQQIMSLIKESAIYAIENKFKTSKIISGINFISLLMNAVYNWIDNQERFKSAQVWIYSQSYFQNFLSKILEQVQEKIEVKLPYSINIRPISPGFLRDMEILRLTGLVRQREVMVSIPKRENLQLCRPRFDICPHPSELSRYVDILKESTTISNIARVIEMEVFKIQGKCSSELTVFFTTEKRIIQKEILRMSRDSMRRFRRHRHEIREDLIRNNACLLVP